jgi:glycosyltransferase involved in cell wall biosynthesis
MKILIGTDTTPDLFSGATTQLNATVEGLLSAGHEVLIIDPSDFYAFTSKKIHEGFHFALWPKKGIKKKILKFKPDAIHIYTECGVGLYLRHFCKKRKLKFTTSYLTRLDVILEKRFKIPPVFINKYMKWFHQGDATMTVSKGIQTYLLRIGCRPPIKIWHPGVHTERFHFDPNKRLNQTNPVFVYFGRIDKEKNLEAFLDLDLFGEKWVIGSGGEFEYLREEYKNRSRFFEVHSQNEINHLLQKCDVLVFPSRFDTFGIVIVEALAAGLPCAAFPEYGPKEILTQGISGFMDQDLKKACLEALKLQPRDCHLEAQRFSISSSVEKFVSHLVLI